MSSSREALCRMLAERSYMEGDFVLTSGARSTFYVDVKRTSFDAGGRQLIGNAIADWLDEEKIDIDCVGGMTLGADAITHGVGTALAARGRSVREVSVRKEAKGHGSRRLIEGNLEEGDRVLVVDDVATSGGSTVQAVDALREAGARVVAAAVVVDRQQGGAKNISARDVRFGAMCTLAELQSVHTR